MRGRDDVAVLVLRDREQTVEILDRLTGHAHRSRDRLVALLAKIDPAHVGPHRGQDAQAVLDRLGITRGEHLGEVFHRDPQLVDRSEEVVLVLAVSTRGAHGVDHGRERRDVPDHRHRAVFRVERQCDAIAVGERVDRGLLR